jgi:Tfp pilus assembly protein PilO
LLNKKDKVVIIGVILCLILLICFIYLPLVKEVRKENREWNNFKKQLGIAQVNLQDFGAGGAHKRLISPQEVPAVIEGLAKEGRDLQINFNSITQKEIKYMADDSAVLPVQIEMEGRYEQLGSFFGILNSGNNSIVTVDSFEIRGRSASLLVNIYLARE